MLEGTHNIPTCRGRNVIFGEPAVTAGGTGIALADTDSDGFGAQGRCACIFSAVSMLILTALTTRADTATDGLRCAGPSDGRVTVVGSYPDHTHPGRAI